MATPSDQPLSFLDLIDICDNVRFKSEKFHRSPFDSETLVPLFLSEDIDTAPVVGLLRPVIVALLQQENERGLPRLWRINVDENSPRPWISFLNWLDTPRKRSAALAELAQRWRDTGLFPDVCGPTKWRDEQYPIYRRPFGAHDYPQTAEGHDRDDWNYAFEMERSACALFGLVTYGVHLSVFEEDAEGGLRFWVPTRAMTKPTWPGYLDNTVAGGIPAGMSVFDSLVKECMEEASIEEHIARKHIKIAGAVSYFFRTSAGWLQPEIEYVYDLQVPSGTANPAAFQPKPSDGEVECFELLPQDEVLDRMRRALFKPNCALVLIDLFVRRGIITPENEPDYMEIVTRLRGRFGYNLW